MFVTIKSAFRKISLPGSPLDRLPEVTSRGDGEFPTLFSNVINLVGWKGSGW